MLKITAIVSLLLIGSTLWAAGLSCDSCGRECASACGTRHFRACCFNYLRRKRISPNMESNKNWHPNPKEDFAKLTKKIPIFAIEDVPVSDPWMRTPNDVEVNSYDASDSGSPFLFDV